ncbi:MAG TPA: xanthine dehydrogenase family protein subunit M [Thermoanaerobaculia bacterium]|nr:xanthine dehydrogenase family protein subunit M [Thermoanaerobaculia bacterium]
MAIIHDMMPAFELYQPSDLDGAIQLLDRHRGGAWVLAGGLDTMDWFKDRVKRPKVVVDLNGVAELRGVRDSDGGLEIGAMTTLTEVVSDPLVRERFSILADAAATVATPQIRNQATLGGNLCQDTRCWYYRGGWPCYRAGGNICYADTPTSMNREHCLFGASRCVAVSPSDTANALVALDAVMTVVGPRGARSVGAEEFFIGPRIDITRMTALQPNEVLAKVTLPAGFAGARFYFEKVRDRQAWDFALVSVAAAFRMEGDTVADARIALGAVAPYPMRAKKAEAALRGKTLSTAVADAAGNAAVEGAKPLHHNAFKIPLTRNLVRRAVRGGALPEDGHSAAAGG